VNIRGRGKSTKKNDRYGSPEAGQGPVGDEEEQEPDRKEASGPLGRREDHRGDTGEEQLNETNGARGTHP